MPPLKGEVPRRGGGVLPPLNLESSIHGRGTAAAGGGGGVCLPRKLSTPTKSAMEGFIAPDGANRSKIRSLRSLFWNGGGEIILFPEFYGNCRLALRDNSISPPLSGFARLGRCPKPCKGAALDLLGLCPRPRKPFFEEKGLDPKNLFSFFSSPVSS